MSHFFNQGIRTATSRPGLAGLLYAFNLVIGIIVTVPIYLTLNSVVGATGFSGELSSQFDITLWMDIMEDALPTFQALLIQLLWILPLFFLWKVVSSVGIIHTVNTDGARSFWQGIGEYTGRAVLMGLVFLVPLIAIVIGIAIVTFVLTMIWTGEIGAFWIYFVFLPVSVILGFAFLDLMHDYARMELVVGNKPVMESMISGLMWPFRHGGSNTIYVGWFVVALVVLILPMIIDFRVGGLWGIFLIQQILLFLRAGITVGWFGSEVAYYDSVVTAEMPAIADIETNFADEGAI